MTSALNSIILAILLTWTALTPAQANPTVPATSKPLHTKAATTAKLRQYFETQLTQPKQYQRLALKACDNFPEGDIFPFAYPCLAFINLSFSDPQHKTKHLAHAKLLLAQLIAQSTRYLRPTHQDLNTLTSYQGQGTWVGTLNTCLGAYIHASQDTHWLPLHDHLSTLLAEALTANKGYPIKSYPSMTWPFDTTPALLSLHINDTIHGKSRFQTQRRQFHEWEINHGTHKATGLPYSQVGISNQSRMKPVLPRGCDLSFRLCLLSQYDKDNSLRIYTAYKKHFWRAQPFVSGFSEWPSGAKQVVDIDSGPIIMDIGLTASGMGLGTAIATQDFAVRDQLLNQLGTLNTFKPLLAAGSSGQTAFGIDFSGPYTTGFLMGDAMLFYAITWHSWGL